MFETIMFLVTALLVIGILFKIIKSIFIIKILMRLAALFFIALIAIMAYTGYSAYKDYKDFSENYPDSEILFVIEHKGEVVSGFILNNNNGTQEVEKIKLSEVKKDYPDDIEDLLEEYYKVLVIDTEAFEDTKIEIDKKRIDFDDIKPLLENDTAELDGIKLDLSGMDTQEIKDYILGAFAVELFKSPTAIIENLRKEKIQILEETMMFKLVKDAPNAIIAPISKKGILNMFKSEDISST